MVSDALDAIATVVEDKFRVAHVLSRDLAFRTDGLQHDVAFEGVLGECFPQPRLGFDKRLDDRLLVLRMGRPPPREGDECQSKSDGSEYSSKHENFWG